MGNTESSFSTFADKTHVDFDMKENTKKVNKGKDKHGKTIYEKETSFSVDASHTLAEMQTRTKLDKNCDAFKVNGSLRVGTEGLSPDAQAAFVQCKKQAQWNVDKDVSVGGGVAIDIGKVGAEASVSPTGVDGNIGAYVVEEAVSGNMSVGPFSVGANAKINVGAGGGGGAGVSFDNWNLCFRGNVEATAGIGGGIGGKLCLDLGWFTR